MVEILKKDLMIVYFLSAFQIMGTANAIVMSCLALNFLLSFEQSYWLKLDLMLRERYAV